jgi:hypothetical protein
MRAHCAHRSIIVRVVQLLGRLRVTRSSRGVGIHLTRCRGIWHNLFLQSWVGHAAHFYYVWISERYVAICGDADVLYV